MNSVLCLSVVLIVTFMSEVTEGRYHSPNHGSNYYQGNQNAVHPGQHNQPHQNGVGSGYPAQGQNQGSHGFGQPNYNAQPQPNQQYGQHGHGQQHHGHGHQHHGQHQGGYKTHGY